MLAKPTGVTLVTHLNNVEREAQVCVSAHPFVSEKYYRLAGSDFQKEVKTAAKFHDVGKEHPKWQDACQKDNQDFLAGKKYGGNLMKVGLRHEIASVIRLQKRMLSEPVKVAIAAHHKKLSHRHEKRWSDSEMKMKGAQTLWDSFKRLSNNAFDPIAKNAFENALKWHYKFSGVRFFTQLADHRASIQENLDEAGRFVPEFKPFLYEFPETWQKRPVQQLAEDFSTEPLLLLRAPTGAGKTDAALLWAKKQIEAGRADRLVVAMPTRFTSNALALNVNERVSETGLYHSSAWFTRHSENAKLSKENEHKERMIHEFARLLESPVTVCTIDHLLASLTLSREDHHGIVFNLAHSCLVIDEADFYDAFTQANIEKLLVATRILDVPVMLMSASLPDSSLKLYENAGYQNVKIREDVSDLSRTRCEIKSIQPYEELDEIEELLELSKTHPTIIYANTVAKAMQLYQRFKAQDVEPVLYHSRFIEADKKEKERLLLEMLGAQAWKEKRANGIAILTQIGEVSVNISADFMISELCPVDRLVQRVGRLSRFGKQVGSLHVILPMKNEKDYPAPYGSFSRLAGWEAIPAFAKTKDLLELKAYSAADFVSLVNKVYDEQQEFSDDAKRNAQKLEESFIYNWLILPANEMKEDEEETEHWKSRNIPAQVTVFIIHPEGYFKNYMEFQAFKNESGIAIPIYLAERGISNGSISSSEIGIRDEKRNILIASNAAYSFEEGLNIDYGFENLSC
jgi:CRISPR-associated endonuclease/helicase Cas3